MLTMTPIEPLRELPGADHLWWLPEPSEVADLITDFTEEHSR
jgi:hypothetical protein